MSYTKADVCAAMERAVAAMTANPDKIISDNLAVDHVGHPVAVDDRMACKFCAIGFVARELGSPITRSSQMLKELLNAGFKRGDIKGIFVANDDGVRAGNKLAGRDALVELIKKEC